MALIKCPECGKEISDKAVHCIHCGYPMELIKQQIVEETKPILKYRVYLNSCSDDARADVIKIVSDVTKKGLIEAKEVINNLPTCIVEDITEEEAKEILELFAHTNANVEYKLMEEGSPSELPFVLRKAKKKDPIISCPTCGMNISSEAHSCPHCGHTFVKEKKGIGFWGVVGAIIVSVFLLLFL